MVLDNGTVLNNSDSIEKQRRSCEIVTSTIMRQQNQNTSCGEFSADLIKEFRTISNMYTFFILKGEQH